MLRLVDIVARGEGMVDLFHFSREEKLATFSTGSNGRLGRVHFDPFGIRFGAVDTKGDLPIWKFEGLDDLKPCRTLKQLHHGALTDFCFLETPNVVATVGGSQHGR